MNLSPDLAHCLLHHTRRSEQAIGVDFDSELVFALYGCLEDMATEQAAKQALILELETKQKSIFSERKMYQGKEIDNFLRLRELKRQNEFTEAMLGQLQNG